MACWSRVELVAQFSAGPSPNTVHLRMSDPD